jgi:hypothetical protein
MWLFDGQTKPHVCFDLLLGVGFEMAFSLILLLLFTLFADPLEVAF